jgi:tol-pal system protein YbgF
LRGSRIRARRVAAACLLTALPPLATGCLTPEQLVTLQQDVTDMRQEVEALRKTSQSTAKGVEDLRSSITASQDAARAQAAESNRRIDALREDLKGVDGRIDGLQVRVEGIAQSLASAPPRPFPPPVGEAPAARTDPGATLSPVIQQTSGPAAELFNQAYADYSKGNYAPAILGFQEFLKANPQTDRSDDALYWIGLSHYDQGEYAEAIALFDRLIQEFPSADKVPGAHLKKGLSLLGMSRTAQGVVQLQHVIERYPKSDEARIAADRLREIGVKP